MHSSSKVPWMLGLMGGLAVACGSNAGTAPTTDAQVATGDAAITPDSGTTPDSGATPDAGPAGLAVLGNGTHSADAVSVRVIATVDDYLATPRDLAFNPEAPRQLWVLNYGDSSMTILRNAGASDQDADNRAGPQHTHFMSHPSSLAFGAPGMLATAHDEDQPTQGPVERGGTPGNFMGPTLWLSGYDEFDGGHASHIDMLHNSPNAVGIAWEVDNAYWVVDGAHRSLTRYDFRTPHEPGGADHSGALVRRHVEGEIGYVEGVAAHAEFDHERGLLYFTDPGNHRVGSLDPSTGMQTTAISPNYDSASSNSQRRMMGTSTVTLFDGNSVGMATPSGLALHGGRLYITDNARSRVYAISLQGEVIDWLDLSGTVQAGGLQGITLDEEGRIYLTDSVEDRVIEVAPR